MVQCICSPSATHFPNVATLPQPQFQHLDICWQLQNFPHAYFSKQSPSEFYKLKFCFNERENTSFAFVFPPLANKKTPVRGTSRPTSIRCLQQTFLLTMIDGTRKNIAATAKCGFYCAFRRSRCILYVPVLTEVIYGVREIERTFMKRYVDWIVINSKKYLSRRFKIILDSIHSGYSLIEIHHIYKSYLQA